MIHRLLSIALIAAGGGLLATRVPMPDGDRFRAMVRALHADGVTGLASVRFEAAQLWAVQPFNVRAVALALIGLMVLAITFSLLWQWARMRNSALGPRADAMQRRVNRARSLSAEGRLGIDVARETALSRDAVELLHHMTRPDELAGTGRSYRSRSRRPSRQRVPA